jgi:hypothetical protein
MPASKDRPDFRHHQVVVLFHVGQFLHFLCLLFLRQIERDPAIMKTFFSSLLYLALLVSGSSARQPSPPVLPPPLIPVPPPVQIPVLIPIPPPIQTPFATQPPIAPFRHHLSLPSPL